MAWRHEVDPTRHKKSQILLAGSLLVILFIVCFLVWLVFLRDEEPETVPEATEQVQVSQEEPQSEPEEPIPQFDADVIQSVLTQWSNSQGGTDSVVITDVDGTVLAVSNPDQAYFAASIYKLYVAYAGYQQLDAGLVDPDEVYVNGNTRAECLDLMIRESDSPCAEKLWVELGKEVLTQQLQELGLGNTDMTGLTTSAADAAIVLSLIASGEGLSDSSQQAFLESMRKQVYRDALNAGFSSDITVYNKIGFRELVEYHDTAFIELSDGRQLVVSVLTENVGTRNIAELARQLEAVF